MAIETAEMQRYPINKYDIRNYMEDDNIGETLGLKTIIFQMKRKCYI